MISDIDFILLAMTYDPTRRDRGLHHYPKLIHAAELKKSLTEKFDEVATQIDHEKDAVAYCVTLPIEMSDVNILDQKLSETFNEILEIANRVSGNSQHLHLFILGSIRQDLDQLNLKTPLFYHIARPD